MPRTRARGTPVAEIRPRIEWRKIFRQSEEDRRLAILNALLAMPHGDVAELAPHFARTLERDPIFFGHLASWYFDHGVVNDLKELFTALMCTSRFSPEFRLSGQSMLLNMPPYQVARVIRQVKGHRKNGRFVPGIAGSVPRSLRSAIIRYLRRREDDRIRFEHAVLYARKSFKYLYGSLRIRPSAFAQKALFLNEVEAGGPLSALAALSQAKDPETQDSLIRDFKIPYRAAASHVRRLTPTVAEALIESMSPQELINHLGGLKSKGLLDDQRIRRLVDSKLQEGGRARKIASLKTRVAVDAAGLDGDLAKSVLAAGDRSLKSLGSIKLSTALLIDISGSMNIAIDVGKQIACIIAPICQTPPLVYTFHSTASRVQADGVDLAAWEWAFKDIQAGGNTSCGSAIELMRERGEFVDQIIIVTDQGENTSPNFVPALIEYTTSHPSNAYPHVVIVNVGSYVNTIEDGLNRVGINHDVYTFKGDYYSLPNLIPMLSGGTRLDLLMEIMDYPLAVPK